MDTQKWTANQQKMNKALDHALRILDWSLTDEEAQAEFETARDLIKEVQADQDYLDEKETKMKNGDPVIVNSDDVQGIYTFVQAQSAGIIVENLKPDALGYKNRFVIYDKSKVKPLKHPK